MHIEREMSKKSLIFMLECAKDQKNALKYASFSRIFIFRVKQFFCRKNIYQRYCQSMVSNNCLNYSSLVWNTKSCNIILSLDFISLRVYPTPKFMNSRYETQICIWKSRLYWNWHQLYFQKTTNAYLKIDRQEKHYFCVEMWKRLGKHSEICIIFTHSYFSG